MSLRTNNGGVLVQSAAQERSRIVAAAVVAGLVTTLAVLCLHMAMFNTVNDRRTYTLPDPEGGHLQYDYGRHGGMLVFHTLDAVSRRVIRQLPKTSGYVRPMGEFLPQTQTYDVMPGVSVYKSWGIRSWVGANDWPMGSPRWVAYTRYEVSLWYLLLPWTALVATVFALRPLRQGASWWSSLPTRMAQRRRARGRTPSAFPVIPIGPDEPKKP